jgi:tetratricopeptide (TPR) repeat protein
VPQRRSAAAPRELHIPFQDLNRQADILSLLSWQTAISDFAGREAEMAALTAWADSPPRISVKFVLGEGGIGKTRLAAELGRALREKGWGAGMVRLAAAQSFAFAEQAVLLVVDYPEEQLAQVKALLAGLARLESDVTLRILFLTRQPMATWAEVVSECRANAICDFEPLALGRIGGPAAHRLYSSALETAAENQNTTPPPLSEDALAHWLTAAPENARTLFIVATAVYGALHPEAEIVSYSGPEIIAALVAREGQRLAAISDEHGLAPDSLAKLLTIAAVTGGLDAGRIERLSGLGKPQALARAAAAAGHGSDQGVMAPTPDIVAAEHVIGTLRRAAEAAPELLWHSVESGDPTAAIGRLGRLSYDAEQVLGRLDSRLGDCLAAALEDNVVRCDLVGQPFTDTRLAPGLVAAAVAVWRTLAEHADNEPNQAARLNNLAIALAAAGDEAGALAAAKRSVEIRECLAKADPARFEPYLAGSLNTLSNRLSASGEAAAALAAMTRSVEIYESLAEADPARFEPDLALSLNNLSVDLSASGEAAAALAAAKRSVEIYQRLAKADPARFEPDLAWSLAHLSDRLREQGMLEEALAATQEGIRLLTPYAETTPGGVAAQRLTALEQDRGSLAAMQKH